MPSQEALGMILYEAMRGMTHLLGDQGDVMLFGEAGDDALQGGLGYADDGVGEPDFDTCTEVETTSDVLGKRKVPSSEYSKRTIIVLVIFFVATMLFGISERLSFGLPAMRSSLNTKCWLLRIDA